MREMSASRTDRDNPGHSHHMLRAHIRKVGRHRICREIRSMHLGYSLHDVDEYVEFVGVSISLINSLEMYHNSRIWARITNVR